MAEPTPSGPLRQPPRQQRARARVEDLRQRAEKPAGTLDEQAVFESLAQAATASAGYGFDPTTFFGSLARFGGVIEWDIADWALRQSWHGTPVPTSLGPDDGTRNQGQAPFSYYYVTQNLAAANSAMGAQAAGEGPSLKEGSIRSGLYVVFIANTRWLPGDTVPFNTGFIDLQ